MRVWATLLLASLIACAERPPTTPFADLGNLSVQQIACFKSVATGMDGNRSSVIRRWHGILLRVGGNPTAQELEWVDSAISEINSFAGRSLIRQTADENQNLDLYFVPRDSMQAYEPHGRGSLAGFVWLYWDSNYFIHEGTIVIANDSQPEQRQHVIREELAHSIGLLGHSNECGESVFSYGYLGPRYTAMDHFVIQTLYRPEIQVRMSASDVDDVLRAMVLDPEALRSF